MNLNIKKNFKLNKKKYFYYSLKEFEKQTKLQINQLPFSIRILLENLIRNQNENSRYFDQIKYLFKNSKNSEIFFKPSRVLMQDFTGIPVIADLAAMSEKFYEKGGDVTKINPLLPVDLVIDHSINVNFYGNSKALQMNTNREFEENAER